MPPRLAVFSATLARRGRVRRILELGGWDVRVRWPRPGDAVGVWGRGRTAWRGESVAGRTGAPLVRIEDAFLRSVVPGRAGSPPLGLLIDRTGLHFDASGPSDLETLLATHPLAAPSLIRRAEDGIARVIEADLSKYNVHLPDLAAPVPGYVLVVDQVRGDASASDPALFAKMLAEARATHPGRRIVIKAHPETVAGHRGGHFVPSDGILVTDPVSPWALLRGAVAVYTVSSQLGFEAILAGHRPQVFGQPFYAGWGLSDDRAAFLRRGRAVSAVQLFAAAMLLAPVWYDPFRDRLGSFETACDALEAAARAWREDRAGYVAVGMSRWKRPALRAMFGPLRFADAASAPALAAHQNRRIMLWASRDPGGMTAVRVEDGFLRSRGLGAALVPPLSLVADPVGIHFDPRSPSRIEALIAADLPPAAIRRAQRLRASIVDAGLTKYALGGTRVPPLPEGHRILVVGQVEDDASVRLGCGAERTNLALLQRARADNPDAVLLWKPHPDVDAGLRAGAVTPGHLVDVTLAGVDLAALFSLIDELWTLTSLAGFEALLRGIPVTCLGAPFYAGWGLTRDLGPVPARRTARPALDALVHAALIAYPRYRDPVTGLPCPPEVIVERLADPRMAPHGRGVRLLGGAVRLRAHLRS